MKELDSCACCRLKNLGIPWVTICKLVLLVAAVLGLVSCAKSANGEISDIDSALRGSVDSTVTFMQWQKTTSGGARSIVSKGVVYVRVPRSDTILHFTAAEARGFKYGSAGDAFDPSFMDTLPGVSHVHSGFNAPGQLVWRHQDGSETIIFDCVNGMPKLGVEPPRNKGDAVCVPMDPVVSFDGKRLAFAVYHGVGEKTRNVRPSGSAASGETWRMTEGTWAGIYIYDFATGELQSWPHETGVWDTAPVWLPNGKMMFTSTRGDVYTRHTFSHSSRSKIQQLWIANRDGTNMHSVGTQQQDEVLHPIILASGRIILSIRELPFARYFNRHGFFDGTGNAVINNVWWLESVDRRGGDLNAHMGTHDFMNVRFKNEGETVYKTSLEAMHFLGQLSNGDICSDIYYRRNNAGAGTIVCWPTKGVGLSPDGHEGVFPFDLPKEAYIAVSGKKSDTKGPKVRDPAGLPDDKIMFSGALGSCHKITGNGDVPSSPFYGGDGKTCDFGIYEKKPLDPGFNPYTDPNEYDEAVEIVNSPHWHEIMPRPVMPYQMIHGIPEPKQPPLPNTGDEDTSYGIFASVNANKANLRAEHGWDGPKDGRWCHFQGCALQAPEFLTHEEGKNYDNVHNLQYMRFWKVLPLDSPISVSRHGNTIVNLWGQKVKLMGDVPVQSDGSFKAKLPANVPFLMAGVDSEGRSIARHQHVMAMRPGEKQVCSGCHLHATTDTRNAQHPFDETLAAALPPVEPSLQWLSENKQPEWRKDIYPMLKSSCSGCHDGGATTPEPDFSENRRQLLETLTNYQAGRHSVYRPRGDKTESNDRAAAPWLTRYINGLFSRESLLYWKAAGKRMDGRTDATVGNDFDFGAEHDCPAKGLANGACLTDKQLRLLSDWIEGGLYCDPSYDFQNGNKARCGLRPGTY